MAVLVSVVGVANPARAAAPRLCSPRDGAVVSNNTPSLGWCPVHAGTIEVWIDGARVATLAGDATRYVPFPLSFGAHHWKVISVSGAHRVSSDVSTFTVSDRPLTNLPPDARLLRRAWFVQSSVTAGMDGARLSWTAIPGTRCCRRIGATMTSRCSPGSRRGSRSRSTPGRSPTIRRSKPPDTMSAGRSIERPGVIRRWRRARL